MKTLFTIICTVTISLFSITATAHGDLKPKHGGIVKTVNDIQYEIVAKPDQITIYVFDHGEKMSLKDASGKLTLLVGKDKTEVPLIAGDDHVLIARGSFNVGKGTKALAVIKIAGKSASINWTLK